MLKILVDLLAGLVGIVIGEAVGILIRGHPATTWMGSWYGVIGFALFYGVVQMVRALLLI